MHYNRFRKNIFSQNGEDGVLLKIIWEIKLKLNNLEVCEFGASDGKLYSNTFNLVKEFNASAVYIEGNKKLYLKLLKLKDLYPSIFTINKYVKTKGKFTLDKILAKSKIKKNFDILSIDIDSYDLEVWKSLKNYRPKIVVIEINSHLIPGIKQYHNKKNNKVGNSFSSTVLVGLNKGYVLAHHYGNLIFVKKKYLSKLSLKKNFLSNPDLLFNFDWVNGKNEFFIIKFIKFLIPKLIVKIIPIQFKNQIIRLLYFLKF
jgi:hypothetical protein